MKKKIDIVLSTFDGMSCGQIALKELGIEFSQYYAAEIDKHAIKQSSHVFPDMIHLGSVTEWESWDIDWSRVDLFLGGSPCQGFSFAGKQLNFDDPRSKLFFVFVDIWNHIKKHNPDAVFLLENVNMRKKYMRVISEHMGVYPVNINSNLVSAQNRNRWYWTNIRTAQDGLFGDLISDIPQPKDRGIYIRDILQDDSEIDKKYYLSEKAVKGVIEHKNRADENGWGFGAKLHKKGDKFNALKVGGTGKDDLLYIREGTARGYTEISPGGCFDAEHPESETRRGRNMESKSNCLMAAQNSFLRYTHDFKLRRLTPTECSRLQTIPDWYEWTVSDTQIYKMLGNGWTVAVIMHIFQYLKTDIK